MTDTSFAAMGGRFAFRCSRCSTIHHWSKEDAWLEVQAGLDPAPAPVAVPAHG